VLESGLDERLLEALNGIKSKGVRVDARLGVDARLDVDARPGLTADAQPAPGVVRIRFAKTYIHDVHVTKSAVMVLKAEHAGGIKYFRGQRTDLNWTNGDNEFRNALIRALNDAVAKLRPELLKLAAGDPVGAGDPAAALK
jgi:hypothetical protein